MRACHKVALKSWSARTKVNSKFCSRNFCCIDFQSLDDFDHNVEIWCAHFVNHKVAHWSPFCYYNHNTIIHIGIIALLNCTPYLPDRSIVYIYQTGPSSSSTRKVHLPHLQYRSIVHIYQTGPSSSSTRKVRLPPLQDRSIVHIYQTCPSSICTEQVHLPHLPERSIVHDIY